MRRPPPGRRRQAWARGLRDRRSHAAPEEAALEQHERLTALKMRLLGDRVSRRVAWTIARQRGRQTTYDAEHLAVIRLQADALATSDPAMATKARDVVPLAPVEALITK